MLNDAARAVLDERAGDRAFDLATLPFYACGAADARRALWGELRVLRPMATIATYLAQVIPRQVEWSVRLHTAAVRRRYLDRAHAVLRDLASA